MRIYLSSTAADLENHRRIVYAALRKAGLDVGAMEDYVASDQRPVDLCLKDVGESDIYVGIFAWRYGYIPPIEHNNADQLSITELEYRRAERKGIPKLIFLLDPKAAWNPQWKDEHVGAGDAGQRILRLREELGREKTASFFESPDQLASLVLAAILRQGADKRVFTVPDLPSGFVPRPERLQALKHAILPRGAPAIAATAALVGSGGFGKTALAMALCHDPEVVAAFPDGILWIEIGENAENLLGRVRDLIKALSGERPDFASMKAASDELAGLLGDRHILMVIDDVWKGAHAEPLLQGGHHCARLMTTRAADAVPKTASKVPLAAMDETEALALLGTGLPRDHQPALSRLAARLGEWPLLLKLANGVLQNRVHDSKQPMDDALRFVGAALDHEGMTAFDARDPVQRNEAVGKTIGVSLGLLDPAGERPRFFELGAFPEDVDIPLDTVTRLWQRTAGFDRYRTEKLCEQLFRHSLLLNFELRAGGTIRLHDAIRKYVRDQLRDRTQLHDHLYESWADPYVLPDDYAWRWFGWHVSQSRFKTKLRELVAQFDWLRAKLEHTDIGGLLLEFDPANVPPDESTRLIETTLRLSAHVLANDPSQLASQMLGRLRVGLSAEIDALREQATQFHAQRWLRPLRPTLAPPGGPLLRTLEGHTGSVRAVAVDPSGRLVISGSDDLTLRIWDLATGVSLRTIDGHDEPVCAVAVTPDGRQVVSGSRDKTLKIWDLPAGTLVRTLAGHADEVWAVAVSADGRRAVSGSKDRSLRVWDLATGEPICTLQGHVGKVSSVALTSDCQKVVSGSDDQTLKVWDMASGKALRTLKGHKGSVNAVAVTPDGQQAISGSSIGSNLDDGIRVWNLANGKMLRMLGPTAGAQALDVSPDGRQVVAGSTDAVVNLWDPQSGDLVCTLRGHSSWVSAVAFTPDSRHVVSGSHDCTLKVWDAALREPSLESGGEPGDGIVAVAITADGAQTISLSKYGVLRLWDVMTGVEVRTVERLEDSHGWAAALTLDGRCAVLGSIGPLEIRDLASKESRYTSKSHTEMVSAVAVTPAGRLAVSASRDKTIKIWEIPSGKLVRTLKGHAGPVDAVTVTPDGQWTVSGSRDGTLKIWSLESGKLRCTLSVSPYGVVAVAVTPDGRQAFLAAGDHTVQVWDLTTGERLWALKGHNDLIRAVAVTPDGRNAISGSHDRSLKVRDLTTGAEVAAFSCDAAIECCEVSAAGVIVCGDALGIVHFLRMSSFPALGLA